MTLGEVAYKLFQDFKKTFSPPVRMTVEDFLHLFPDLSLIDSLLLELRHMTSLDNGEIMVYPMKDGDWVADLADTGSALGQCLQACAPNFYEAPYLDGSIILSLFDEDLLKFLAQKGITLLTFNRQKIGPETILDIYSDAST
jgi:hypothetical protein